MRSKGKYNIQSLDKRYHDGTEEISEFRSPETSFSYIYNGRRSFLEHFLVTTKQGRMKSDNFAIKTPVLRKISMKKCQKCKIDPFT